MPLDVVFFLAPDDRTAAAARPCGPGRAFDSVTCHGIEPDTAIAEWDLYFATPSPGLPAPAVLHRWAAPKNITPFLNDGIEMYALPKRLTEAMASAGNTGLQELADRWATRLRRLDAMPDDDLLDVLQGVARLAASAASTGGRLYSWSF